MTVSRFICSAVLFISFIDCRGRQRLLREQRELKAPQERSDEEIEAVPAERVCLKQKFKTLNRLYVPKGPFQKSRCFSRRTSTVPTESELLY